VWTAGGAHRCISYPPLLRHFAFGLTRCACPGQRPAPPLRASPGGPTPGLLEFPFTPPKQLKPGTVWSNAQLLPYNLRSATLARCATGHDRPESPVTIAGIRTEAGDVDASHNLGMMYLRGLGVEKDLEKSIFYLEKSMAKLTNWSTANVFQQKAIKELANQSTSREQVTPPANKETKSQVDFPTTTEVASDISRNIFKAMMELPNEEWAKDKIFMATFAKTDGSEEALSVTKRRFALAAARAMETSQKATSGAQAIAGAPESRPISVLTKGMTLQEARQRIPALAGLNDAQAYDFIHSVYYPTVDKDELAKFLNYTPESSNLRPQEWVFPNKNAGTLLFWVLLLGGVVGYFLTRSRYQNTKYATAETADPLYGVRGWLAFFVICLGILGPALTLGKTAGSFYAAEKAYTVLINTPTWTTYKNSVWVTLAAFSAFSIFSAIQMQFNRTPASITLAKISLVSWPVAAWLIGVAIPDSVFLGNAPTTNVNLVGLLISAIATCIIWITYLSMSKRVRVTYRAN